MKYTTLSREVANVNRQNLWFHIASLQRKLQHLVYFLGLVDAVVPF